MRWDNNIWESFPMIVMQQMSCYHCQC